MRRLSSRPERANAGFYSWLEVKHGTSYVGPVPPLMFWLVPTFAGIWHRLWRPLIGPRRLWILGVCTPGAAISVLALSVARGMGIE